MMKAKSYEIDQQDEVSNNRPYTRSVRKRSNDGILLDLTGMDRQELLDLKLQVEVEMSSIKSQLAEAKGRAATEGEYSDPIWFRRAHDALRIKGRHAQQIQIELGKSNRAKKDAEQLRWEKVFVDVSKELLEENIFEKLQTETSRRVFRS